MSRDREIQELRAEVQRLKDFNGARWAGDIVIVRAIDFHSATQAAAGPTDRYMMGLLAPITGSEVSSADMDIENNDDSPSSGTLMQGGILVTGPGGLVVPLMGGTVRVYRVPLVPVSGDYEGETEFATGFYDLVQETMDIRVLGSSWTPGDHFTYSTATGIVTFAKPAFRDGETVPDNPAAEVICFSAERRLGA